MAPYNSRLPDPVTESARAMRQAFFCHTCNKGYARSNELQAHEVSYEHNHNLRLAGLKHINRDAANASASKAASNNNNQELQRMSLNGPKATGEVKKKPRFVPIGTSSSAAARTSVVPVEELVDLSTVIEDSDPSAAKRNGWWNERYESKFCNGCFND